jgi:ribosome-dependent ATPase
MANRAIVTQGYVEAFIADYNSRLLAESGITGNMLMPVEILFEAKFNPSLESTNVLVPGIAGLVLLIFPAVLAAISLSRERESGMILNFYTSPLSRFQFLLGKSLPLLTIGLINYVIFFALSIWLFRVPFGGDFDTLTLAIILYLITTVGIGFLVATLVRSEVAALLIASIVTFLPGFLYSGLMMPVQSMGAEGKMMASILPAYYFIRIAKAVFLKRLGLGSLLGELGALAAIAVVLFGLAILRLKKKM